MIADARMSPHECIACADGRLVKVDGARHGDDYFFPGPVDIAWDLAGAIVEWEMDRGAEEYLLRQFREKSGIKPENISAYLLAYSIFRASYCEWLGWGPGWNRKSRACMWRMGSTGATLMPLCDDWRKSPLSSSAALQNLFCRKGVKVPTLSHRTRQGWGTPLCGFFVGTGFRLLVFA